MRGKAAKSKTGSYSLCYDILPVSAVIKLECVFRAFFLSPSRIKARLEEHKPERVKPFMTGAAEQIKHILANFKNYQVSYLLTVVLVSCDWFIC